MQKKNKNNETVKKMKVTGSLNIHHFSGKSADEIWHVTPQ